MAMTKVVSLKVPDEAEGLQARLGLAAKKAGIPTWELLTQLLDIWDRQHEAGEPIPAGVSWEEWKADIEAEVRSLRVELDEIKAQRDNGIPVNHRIKIIESGEQEPVLLPKVDETSELDIQSKEEPGQAGLLVNQGIESDIKTFEAAYNKLERGQHTAIWKLRDALAWPDEQFDTTLRCLRDEGRYQLQAGDTERMTKEQIKAGFTDENGFHFLTVMRLPHSPETPRPSMDDTGIEASEGAPMGTTAADESTLETSAVPPTSQRRGRPRKQQQEAEKAIPLIPSAEFFSKVVQSVQTATLQEEPETQAKEEAPSTAAVPEEEPAASPRRKPGKTRRGSV
jgi:hypothetical protein